MQGLEDEVEAPFKEDGWIAKQDTGSASRAFARWVHMSTAAMRVSAVVVDRGCHEVAL